MSFDSETQTAHYKITLHSDELSSYTMSNFPVWDYLRYTPGVSCFSQCGVTSTSVQHKDGSTESVELTHFSQPDPCSWKAVIPQICPGDTITINSYVTLSNEFWKHEIEPGVGGGSFRNYFQIGPDVNVDGYPGLEYSDLPRVSYETFESTKKWLTKNSPEIKSDRTIDWEISGNEPNEIMGAYNRQARS